MQLADYVGRILFPQQDRWERRRNLKVLLIALAIFLGALLFGLIYIHKRLQQNELNPEPQMIIQPALSFGPSSHQDLEKQRRTEITASAG
jgi:hypothetical protein